jgi:hypothetical protein
VSKCLGRRLFTRQPRNFRILLGVKSELSLSYHAWAEGLVLAGKMQDAKNMADRALELAVASGEHGNEVGTLCILGAITASEAPAALVPACSLYEQAKTLAEELGMRPVAADCHLGLGRLYRRTGDATKAHEHLTIAATMYREMGMGFWLEKAEAELGLPRTSSD